MQVTDICNKVTLLHRFLINKEFAAQKAGQQGVEEMED